jgi:heat shock protein HslJ
MKRLQLLLLTIAMATVLGACSAAGTSASPSASAPTPSLAGRTFLSTDLQGATLVPGTRITLTFKDDGSLGAGAGCNSMGGAYTIAGDRLTTGQMMMTEMGCAEPLMMQDSWLSTFLSDVKYTLDGDTLTLEAGSATITLVDKTVATPDQPIEGTLWVVDGIVSGEAVSSVPEGVTASIRIADGQAEVRFGCNSGGGPVEVTPDTLTFGPMISTKMACEPDAMAMEAAVSTVLTGTVPYSIDADSLTLDAGVNGLILRAAP